MVLLVGWKELVTVYALKIQKRSLQTNVTGRTITNHKHKHLGIWKYGTSSG